jgi:hypothetical protein
LAKFLFKQRWRFLKMVSLFTNYKRTLSNSFTLRSVSSWDILLKYSGVKLNHVTFFVSPKARTN